MARRCSHCNHDGHNSRTCPNRGVRIFGVRLSDGSLQKSASTGNLAVYARSGGGGGGGGSPHIDPLDPSVTDTCVSGYVSEGFNVGPASHERKKGVPWTEHEHKMFLVGLKKLGKGDWRGIARSYVISRTPTQVASHAQKYFIRHSSNNRRKRRISLFDIVTDETSDENLSSSSPEQEVQDTSCIHITEEQADINGPVMHETTMQYTYPPPIYPVFFPIHQVSEEQAAVEGGVLESPTVMHFSYSTFYPGFFAPGLPYCPGYAPHAIVSPSHEIIKPLAVHSKSPIKVDERLGLSRLSLGVCNGQVGSLILRPGLVGGSQRQSAFQSGSSTGGSNLNSGSGSSSSSSPIHAT